MTGLLCGVEQPRRHVERIPDIGDFAPQVADFAGDDLAVVKRGPELELSPKVGDGLIFQAAAVAF